MQSLYDFPLLYDLFFRPDAELWQAACTWIRRYLDAPPAAVLDPACGPGTWLLPCAHHFGCRVAGNDIRPAAIAAAEQLLQHVPHELVVADMRRLRFRTAPFDLALNFDSSVGHLPDHGAVADHLQAVSRVLRPGGLYLLGITTLEETAFDHRPLPLFDSGVTPYGDGRVWVRYHSLWRDPANHRECIQLQLNTQDVDGVPPFLQESYELLTFTEAALRSVLRQSGPWQLRAMHSMVDPGFPDVPFRPGCRAVTLALTWPG